MEFLTFYLSVNYDQKKCRFQFSLGILWDSIHVTSTIIEVIIAVKCSFLEISKNLAAIWTQQEITLDDKNEFECAFM